MRTRLLMITAFLAASVGCSGDDTARGGGSQTSGQGSATVADAPVPFDAASADAAASSSNPPEVDSATNVASRDASSAPANSPPDTGVPVPDASPGVTMMPSDAGAMASDAGSSPAPAIDYAAKGRFTDAKMFADAGPNGSYVLYRPDNSLGREGFKHPIGVWGNGLGTTPDQYQQLFTLVASHGFVVIGCPDVISEEPCLNDGLDWLAKENNGTGALAGKLDTTREFTIGYSWGGGAAIDSAKRANVKATISMHGMPPRNDPWAMMHAPLLLFTSTADTLVSPDQIVTPNYMSSQVQTFYATVHDDAVGHMYVLDPDSFSCEIDVGLGACTGAAEERGPVVAWLSYWLYGDQAAKSYFFGDDCKLCTGKWTAQRKKWM